MKDKKESGLFVPFLRSHFPGDIGDSLAAVFESGYVGAGCRADEFEKALQDFLGAPSLTLTSTCTAALALAYRLAGVERDSVVLSTPMTCAATNIPLLQIGARLYWLDVDPLSGNVTTDSVLCGLMSHPEARAVVLMDWGGNPCDYPGIAEICRKANAVLILDAAQSFGSTLDGRRHSPDVDYTCYSFGPTKLLTSIEGGAIALPRDQEARARALRWYGIRRDQRDSLRFWEYDVKELSDRSVSNDLFAAVGLTMLGHFANRLRLHRSLAAMYNQLLDKVPGVNIVRPTERCEPSYWLYTLTAERREELLLKLHRAGFHAATPHRRNDRLLAKWCEARPSSFLPGVDQFDASYVCLPIGPWVRPADVETICEHIKAGW